MRRAPRRAREALDDAVIPRVRGAAAVPENRAAWMVGVGRFVTLIAGGFTPAMIADMSKGIMYLVEDGPGAGRFVDVTVRVMVGTRWSTVLVERQGELSSLYETREHGRETDGLGAAIEAAVREELARLPKP